MTEETDPGIPKLYYVSEIAKVWQVEKRWIMARIHDGRFEAVKMANGWAMTHGQMSAALESISNQDKRKQRTEREEWKPPHGITPRSWAYHQRWPDGNPHMRGPRRKPGDPLPDRPKESPLPRGFRIVAVAKPGIIASLPPLTDPQRRLLTQVRKEGSVVVNGRCRNAVEALALRGLITYEAKYVISAKTLAYIYQFIVRPVGSET